MKSAALLLGAASIALAGTSAYLWNDARGERERNDGLKARVSELEAQLQRQPRFMAEPPPPPPPMAQLAEAPAAPKAPTPPAPAPRAESTPAPTIGRMDPTAYFAREQRMLQDPEYRALRREQQKMGMMRMYSDLGAALDLSDAQVDQVLDVLADNQLNSRPPFFPGEDASESKRTEWMRQMEENQRKQDAHLKALLGDSKYQEWEDYQASMGARMQVRNLRSMLEGSSETLRQDQYEQLVRVIADAQSQSRTDSMNDMFRNRPAGPLTQADQLAMMEKNLEHTAQQNQRMRDAAAPYLSTAQLERYDKLLKQQLDMQRVHVKMMREGGESGGPVAFFSDGATIMSSQGGTISQSVGTVIAVPPPTKP